MSEPAVTIRDATVEDSAAIAAVHVASWREHYAAMIERGDFEERSLASRIEQWQQTLQRHDTVTLVAQERSGAIVGFAGARVFAQEAAGFDSYLQTLYLLARATGRGTGRALLRALAARLTGTGRTTMALRVLRENPARAFYERLGARLAPEGIADDAGLFDDVVYAFDDLRILL